MGILIPSETDTTPCWSGILNCLESGALHKDVASRQLKEDFPELTPELIREEYKARREAADAITLASCFENMAEVASMARMEGNQGEYSLVLLNSFDLLSRLHFRRLYSSIGAFAAAKVACRSHALAGCRIRHEARTLITSTILCRDLFPVATVTEVLRRAASGSRNLVGRWRISLPQTEFRKPSGRGRSPFQSPRTSPAVSPSPGPSGTPRKRRRPNPKARANKQAQPATPASPAAHPQRDARAPPTFRGSSRGKGPRFPKGPSSRGAPPTGPQ